MCAGCWYPINVILWQASEMLYRYMVIHYLSDLLFNPIPHVEAFWIFCSTWLVNIVWKEEIALSIIFRDSPYFYLYIFTGAEHLYICVKELKNCSLMKHQRKDMQHQFGKLFSKWLFQKHHMTSVLKGLQNSLSRPFFWYFWQTPGTWKNKTTN